MVPVRPPLMKALPPAPPDPPPSMSHPFARRVPSVIAQPGDRPAFVDLQELHVGKTKGAPRPTRPSDMERPGFSLVSRECLRLVGLVLLVQDHLARIVELLGGQPAHPALRASIAAHVAAVFLDRARRILRRFLADPGR